MNTLSWMLYGIDVVDNLNSIVSAAVAFSIIGIIGSWVVERLCSIDEDDIGKLEKRFAACLKLNKMLVSALVVFVTISIFIPTKNTLYAIAASELGEKVATSEIGTDALKAVQTWIKNQITPEPKK